MKMKKLWKLRILAAGSCALLAAVTLPMTPGIAQTPSVSDPAALPAGFSPDTVKAALAARLPGMWSLTRFAAPAMINARTLVDPEMQTRFEAQVALAADTFVVEGRDGPVTFVRPIAPKGMPKTLYGTSRSTLQAGRWETQLNFQNADVLDGVGQPLATIAGRVIVRGSPEEAEYAKQREQAAAQAQQAALSEIARKEQLAAEQRKADAADAEAKLQQAEADALAQSRREAATAAIAAEQAATAASAAAARKREQDQLDADAAAKLQQTRTAAELASLQQQQQVAGVRQTAEQARRKELDALRASLQSQSASERLAALESGMSSTDPTIRTLAVETALAGKDTVAQNVALRQLLSQKRVILFNLFAPAAWAQSEQEPRGAINGLGSVRLNIKDLDLGTGRFAGDLQLGKDKTWEASGSIDRTAVTISARGEGKPLDIYGNPNSLSIMLQLSPDKQLDGIARLGGGGAYWSPLIARVNLD